MRGLSLATCKSRHWGGERAQSEIPESSKWNRLNAVSERAKAITRVSKKEKKGKKKSPDMLFKVQWWSCKTGEMHQYNTLCSRQEKASVSE
jgi:hypothetical protein